MEGEGFDSVRQSKYCQLSILIISQSTISFIYLYTELEEEEKKCVHEEINRLLKRAAEKASIDNGYGREYLIDSKDLKNFFDKELRIEHAEDRELDRQFIHHESHVVNKGTQEFQVTTANKTTKEETKKARTSKQAGAAIKGGKECMQFDMSNQAKGEREQESKVVVVTEVNKFLVPKGIDLGYKVYVKDEYKLLLAKADKDFKFRVYLGHPVARGAAAGGGTGALGGVAVGAGIGAAVGSIVPGIGNLIGAGVGATIGLFAGGAAGVATGAGIGAGWQKEVNLNVKEVFSRYKEEDKDWEEDGRYMVYKVRYRYKHPKEDYELSEAK